MPKVYFNPYWKKRLGIFAIVAGLVMIGFSMYINQEITKGQSRIASGKHQIAQGKQAFSLIPTVGKTMGDQVTASGQRQIMQGEADIAYYQGLANKLLIFGIILVLVGGVLVLLPKLKRFK